MSSTADALERLHRFNGWFRPAETATSTPQSAVRGVRLTGYLSDESGWGAAGRGYARALQQCGVPMSMHDVSRMTVNRSGDRSLTVASTAVETDVNLVCVDAGQHFALLSEVGDAFFHGHYNIGAWAWELPRFPDSWYNRFAYYDEIWVGTSFIASALAPISPVPVVRVPPVVTAPSGLRARGRQRLNAGERECIFLFAFDVHSHLPRKNPHSAIQAFRQAFGQRDDVRLVLKSVNAAADAAGYAALRELAAGTRVDLLDGYWDRADVADLFAACDAYVSLHRSEGIGLTIAEAMAAGKPVIATDWSGNTDFADTSNSYPVAYDLTTVQSNVGPYRAGETWAEPDIAHAARQMASIVNDPATAQRRGAAARARMARDYSEQAIATLVSRRLDVIGSRDLLPTLRHEVTAFVDGYQDLVESVRTIAACVIPSSATVAVVSRGDANLVDLDGRAAWHFPEARPGVYAGHHPANSDDAVQALEASRSRGAEFLLLPGTAFWWLEHYDGFQQHLDRRCTRVWQDARCAIYDLRRGTAA